MTNDYLTEKITGAIGLALKAGKCVSGTNACLDKIRAGKGKLLIIACDVSENTKDRLESAAGYRKVPFITIQKGKLEFSKLAGKRSDTASFLITDSGFVKIIEKLGIEIHLTNTEVLN